MNRSLVTGVVVGVAAAAGAGAFAGYKILNKGQDYAQVLEVTPLSRTIRTAHQDCQDVPVTRQAPTRDPHQLLGTIAGAVVGGVIGHQIGGGSGKELATVAGAAAGGYGGNRLQNHLQQQNTYTTTEARCETVYDKSSKQIGYKVRYQLDGQVHTIKMSHDPGKRIPVENGRLVISNSV